MIQFEFNEKAAVEAVLYLAHHSQTPTFHHIFKLLYFADRLHLERYGRFIYGDRYIAMSHGPVPSAVYDMLKDVRDELSYINFPRAEGAFQVVNGHHVVPLRTPELGWLSESDIECLNAAIAQYDSLSFDQLTHISHDEAWKSADEDEAISVESIVKSMGNPDDLLEYLRDPHP